MFVLCCRVVCFLIRRSADPSLIYEIDQTKRLGKGGWMIFTYVAVFFVVVIVLNIRLFSCHIFCSTTNNSLRKNNLSLSLDLSFGEVFLARDLRTGEKVAVKKMQVLLCYISYYYYFALISFETIVFIDQSKK